MTTPGKLVPDQSKIHIIHCRCYDQSVCK